MIETKYSLYVCEIKLRKKIRTNIIEQMQEKIKRLGSVNNLSIKPILIYIGSIDKNIISSKYFSEIINFEQLLTNGQIY